MHSKKISSPYLHIISGLVLILLLFTYIRAIPNSPFFGDESHWIHTSVYWEILLEQPSTSPFWSENYWTLTQPPVTRYIIGIARNIQGFNSEQLNNPWEFSQSFEENAANNNMPSQDLLFASRVPMAILAALTGWVIFLIILNGYGILAAVLFVLLYAFNDYLIITLVRAMGESPMLFFLTLSSFFLILAIREFIVWSKNETPDRKAIKSYFLFSLSGIACGLAGASKINGLMAGASIALIVFALLFFFSPSLNKNLKIKMSVRIIFIFACSVILPFILINPFLYASPLSRIGLMAKFRLYEMGVQIAGFPDMHINTLSERVPLLFAEVFSQYMPFHLPAILYFLLVGIGAINLINRLLDWNKSRQNFPTELVLVLVLLPLALAGYATPLNWDRYFLSSVMLNMICAPIGIAYLLKTLPGILNKINSRRKQSLARH